MPFRACCPALALVCLSQLLFAQHPPRQMEYLDRGSVAVRQPDGSVFLSWRLLGTEPAATEFNVYRIAEGAGTTLVTPSPLSGATNWIDREAPADTDLRYQVVPVENGTELPSSQVVSVWSHPYLEIPIEPIPEYRPGDASVGDLDGDGQLEIVLHQSSRGRDNGSAGITGTPILDAYRLDGTHLWRIDLGKNIREGEHYTQFMVYDLDGDGRAEIACKTADGTIDGKGNVIGDGSKDWRTLREGSLRNGRILDGPEFFTIFDGMTGAVLKTVDYIPNRFPIDGWGGIGGNAGNDSYGNRCDRFLACIAYLDGQRPSVVMCRGVYGRIVMAAWDWRDGELSSRWVFDSGSSYPPYDDASPFSGMGGHSLSVADVDNDGKDEIVYQAMVVDDDGTGLYSTGLRHGDAMYISDLNPQRPGMEVFTVQENEDDAELFQTPGAAVRDAQTGEILWSHSPTVDVPAGMAADIDPRHVGFEIWGGPGGLRDISGNTIGTAPRLNDWSLWWDGDPLRELLQLGRPAWPGPRRGNRERSRSAERTSPAENDVPQQTADSRDNRDSPSREESSSARGADSNSLRRRFRFGPRPTEIFKWNWETEKLDLITSFDAVTMSRGPCIAGDLLGDWREELLLVAPDGKSLRLYTTTIPTEIRLPTLLHNPQYRLGLAWQNVVYNKPCYPDFYLGEGMSPPDPIEIEAVGQENGRDLR